LPIRVGTVEAVSEGSEHASHYRCLPEKDI